jgi:raffinose/stachyose/melibiose transport system substrate-binding protein
MKNKRLSLVLLIIIAVSLVAGGPTAHARARAKIYLWFWGAAPQDQVTMNEVLADAYNASQDQYELVIEFRNTVDQDIAVALAAGEGPDIVYGSGPSFVSPYAAAGKLEPMDKYSEQYGWKDRILAPIYESGTVNGVLYALPNSLNTYGVFYNKVVLEENGWTPPTTVEELEAIMDAAMEKGMYASVTGNKGWRPVNENYTTIFLTHLAGPENVYKALMGEIPWTSEPFVAAMAESARWYQKGYLAGEDYVNLNFNDAFQLLAARESPFFIGPTLGFQMAASFFNEDNGNVDELGFVPFPSYGDLPYPLFALGTTASLSINGSSKHKDAAAEVINMMMTQDFLIAMTKRWPGYWGVPVKALDVDPNQFEGLSREYIIAIQTMIQAVNEGRFGYASVTFFPPATLQEFINIDTVWMKTTSVEDFMARVESVFEEELAKGMVPPIPKPGGE